MGDGLGVGMEYRFSVLGSFPHGFVPIAFATVPGFVVEQESVTEIGDFFERVFGGLDGGRMEGGMVDDFFQPLDGFGFGGHCFCSKFWQSLSPPRFWGNPFLLMQL